MRDMQSIGRKRAVHYRLRKVDQSVDTSDLPEVPRGAFCFCGQERAHGESSGPGQVVHRAGRLAMGILNMGHRPSPRSKRSRKGRAHSSKKNRRSGPYSTEGSMASDRSIDSARRTHQDRSKNNPGKWTRSGRGSILRRDPKWAEGCSLINNHVRTTSVFSHILRDNALESSRLT